MPSERHLAQFLEFVRLETATHGPDPHMALLVYGMNKIDDDLKKAWLVGCYVGFYEVNTGAQVWGHWPIEKALAHPEEFTSWIQENWPRLQVRRERRAVRTPGKMVHSLLSYATWARDTLPGLREASYEALWKSGDKELYGFGRYALTKLFETLHRGGLLNAAMEDIRPAGAWSPRKTLSWIYPEREDDMINAKGPMIYEQVEELRQLTGLDYFRLEVLLCNYRQAIERKYPGRPQDTDLGYYYKVVKDWGEEEMVLPFFRARRELFPHQVLGELQGWPGPRDELGSTFAEHGYFWSDLLYDYHATEDLAQPVKR